MPTQKEFDDLKALVERIAAIPRIQAQLEPGTWPKKMSMGAGVVEPINDAALAIPKSRELIRAELAEAEAKAAFDKAQDRWLAASNHEPGGRYIHSDGLGSNVVEDVPATPFFAGRLDIPEYEAHIAAERALISARVRMFTLQKRREQEMAEYERKKNPPKNVTKPDSAIARIVKWPGR
jgi:hypothetical protein